LREGPFDAGSPCIALLPLRAGIPRSRGLQRLILRLLAGLVLLYTARILCKGRVTLEAIVFSLTHHGRFLNAKNLELHGLSWDLDLEAA
jgi:hypothetical protein